MKRHNPGSHSRTLPQSRQANAYGCHQNKECTDVYREWQRVLARNVGGSRGSRDGDCRGIIEKSECASEESKRLCCGIDPVAQG